MPKPPVSSNSTLLALVVISLMASLPATGSAIVITSPFGPSPTHVDRYENDSNFLSLASPGSGAVYDFTGVGQSGSSIGGSGLSKWGTMISPTTFLSASHSHPSAGTTLTFSDNNGNSIATHTVGGGYAIQNSDLWVGQLTSAVDTSQVAIYDVAAPSSNFYLDAKTLQVGVGGSSTPQFRVGQNQLDSLILSDPGVVSQSIFGVYMDNSEAGGLGSEAGQSLDTPTDPLLPYETYFEGGDSGAPTFVATPGGQLSVLGIHSFVAAFTTERRGSADVYLPYYYDEIQAAIPVNVSAVPEPSAFLFLVFATICLGFFRKMSATEASG